MTESATDPAHRAVSESLAAAAGESAQMGGGGRGAGVRRGPWAILAAFAQPSPPEPLVPRHPRFPSVLLFAGLLSLAVGVAAAPDWRALADVREVDVLTHDADGDPREVVVWLAVLEGNPFVRAGGMSIWGRNALREGRLVLRARGVEYPLRVEAVEDEAARERVFASFREKYGWQDAMLYWMRGSEPPILQLLPRKSPENP